MLLTCTSELCKDVIFVSLVFCPGYCIMLLICHQPVSSGCLAICLSYLVTVKDRTFANVGLMLQNQSSWWCHICLVSSSKTLLSVQCYAWTECKFTCVCVCLSITLSVNSPTGQTPQQFSTVDSLTDAHLCKDVPFGGLDDE